MKRSVFHILMTALCTMAMATSKAVSTPISDGKPLRAATSFLKGDVNGDGVRSVMDVSLLVDYIMSGHGDFDIALGDMDGSGTISVSDISILVEIILGADYDDPDNPSLPLDDIGGADPGTGV